jgi:hypothetical protein
MNIDQSGRITEMRKSSAKLGSRMRNGIGADALFESRSRTMVEHSGSETDTVTPHKSPHMTMNPTFSPKSLTPEKLAS